MDYADVSSTFVRLADTHFVQRCPQVPEGTQGPEVPPQAAPTLVLNEKDMYAVPRLNLVGEELGGGWGLPEGGWAPRAGGRRQS